MSTHEDNISNPLVQRISKSGARFPAGNSHFDSESMRDNYVVLERFEPHPRLKLLLDINSGRFGDWSAADTSAQVSDLVQWLTALVTHKDSLFVKFYEDQCTLEEKLAKSEEKKTKSSKENARLKRLVRKLERLGREKEEELVSSREMNSELLKDNARLEREVKKLKRQKAKLNREKFVGKSDSLPEDVREEEGVDKDIAKEASARLDYASRKKKRRSGGRKKKFPAHLERVRVEPETPTCGCKFPNIVIINETETETLEVKESPHQVNVTVRKTCKCTNCKKIFRTPLPRRVFNRGYLGERMVSQFSLNRVLMGTPLNRHSDYLSYIGIDLPPKTLNNYFIKTGDALKPLHRLLLPDLLVAPRIIADDCVYPMNIDKDSDNLTRGRLWHYLRDDRPFGGTGPNLLYCEVTPDWRSQHAKQLLSDYTGIIQGDSYPGWKSLARESEGRILLMNCFAHARRKVVDVGRYSRDIDQEQKRVVLEILAYIRKIFKVERDIFGKSPEERLAVRKERSEPLVRALWDLMENTRSELEDDHSLAQAMDYMLSTKETFTLFLEDGHVCLSTNAVESLIRTFAISRQNFGHANSIEGAEAHAVIASLAITCHLSGVNPYEWLYDVLKRLPYTDEKDLWKLLPYHWKKEREGLDPDPMGTQHGNQNHGTESAKVGNTGDSNGSDGQSADSTAGRKEEKDSSQTSKSDSSDELSASEKMVAANADAIQQIADNPDSMQLNPKPADESISHANGGGQGELAADTDNHAQQLGREIETLKAHRHVLTHDSKVGQDNRKRKRESFSVEAKDFTSESETLNDESAIQQVKQTPGNLSVNKLDRNLQGDGQSNLKTGQRTRMKVLKPTDKWMLVVGRPVALALLWDLTIQLRQAIWLIVFSSNVWNSIPHRIKRCIQLGTSVMCRDNSIIITTKCVMREMGERLMQIMGNKDPPVMKCCHSNTPKID